MPGHPTPPSSWLECAAGIFADGGLRSLYRGIGPNMAKAVPSLSVSYLVFEQTKCALRRRQQLAEASS